MLPAEGRFAGKLAVFIRVGELLSQNDALPVLRAALYRVSSGFPGVEFIGDRTDPSGRSGVAVGVTYQGPGARIQVLMIFGEETSALLSQERILLERAPWVDAGARHAIVVRYLLGI
jgi:hypothetical protein